MPLYFEEPTLGSQAIRQQAMDQLQLVQLGNDQTTQLDFVFGAPVRVIQAPQLLAHSLNFRNH
jgi:hypothetical protein